MDSCSFKFLAAFKSAFEKQYTSANPRILLQTIDEYLFSTTYYNNSFPIIQSSGMGKSRLVDHSATLRFTIPFNLHEPLPGHTKSAVSLITAKLMMSE
jgi:hypothetical protein